MRRDASMRPAPRSRSHGWLRPWLRRTHSVPSQLLPVHHELRSGDVRANPEGRLDSPARGRACAADVPESCCRPRRLAPSTAIGPNASVISYAQYSPRIIGPATAVASVSRRTRHEGLFPARGSVTGHFGHRKLSDCYPCSISAGQPAVLVHVAQTRECSFSTGGRPGGGRCRPLTEVHS